MKYNSLLRKYTDAFIVSNNKRTNQICEDFKSLENQ